MALEALTPFTAWLAATPVSQTIGQFHWITPAVQCVHILAIAVVMSAILMMDLRLLGMAGTEDPIQMTARRYLPWVWWCLLVLFVSGATLIVGEPRRSLQNPIFLLKMALLVGAAGLTALTQRPFGEDAGLWQAPRYRSAAKVLAVASLILWVGIVFCGRWIAYAQE
jgi:cytochrome bd-type quinol oxidase subunit 2